MQGFHPAPILFTSCLGDTGLQSPHATMCDRPVNLVPFANVTGDRRIRLRRSHSCLPPVEGIRHTLSPYHTTRKSAPLSGRARCLLSGRLRPGIRFLRNPLPAVPSHALQLADPAGPSGREDNGFTEFHDDDPMGRVLPIYRRYCASVFRQRSGTSDRMPFWPRRIQLLSPVNNHGSNGSSPEFTRPPSLAPHPLIAGRIRGRSSRIDSAACAGVHCPGALDGSLRNPPLPVGSLMTEHQVGSTSLRAGSPTIIAVALRH